MSDEAKLMHEKVRAAQERTIRNLESQNQALQERIEELEQREPTWADWIAWMDRHYPAHIFTGESGDPGPRAIAAFRAALSPTQETDPSPIVSMDRETYQALQERAEKAEAALREIEAGPYNGFEQCRAIARAALSHTQETDPE